MKKIKNILSSLENKRRLALLSLLMIMAFAIFVHTRLWIYNTAKPGQEEDIYYIWTEGKRLLLAQNPYERTLSGNMRENHKYATYFPLFYVLAYLTQLFGLRDYSAWLYFWRHIFLLFNMGITLVIFYALYQKKLIVIAIFSVALWLFNRWTLYVTTVAQIDFLPIFFLILSLMIFQKYKWWSLLLYSLSLALKQIAIFLMPLYLIWIWQSANRDRVKQVLIAAAVIISIPFITSLPFLFWNANGLLKSILFSATRKSVTHFNAPSLDACIELYLPSFVGIKAKLPMLLLMTLIYLATVQRQIGIYIGSLLTMIVFIDFNSVLFIQYMCWIVPLIPLSIGEGMHNRQKKELQQPS